MSQRSGEVERLDEDDLVEENGNVDHVNPAKSKDDCDDIQEVHGGSSTPSGSCWISTENKNPLENPVILQHLFKLCPASTLASCRLVSKLWRDESLSTWRSAFPITISMEVVDRSQGLGYLTRYYNQSMPPSSLLKEFLEFNDELRKQDKPKPYRNLRIRWCEFGRVPESFQLFWNVTGSTLTTLNLFRCKFSSIQEFRQVIYNSCTVLQNLVLEYCSFSGASGGNKDDEFQFGEHKHLRSLHVHLDYQIGEAKLPVSWIELLSTFSNLTSFEYDGDGNFPESEFESMIGAILTIRKVDKGKLPFKHFQIQPSLIISRKSGHNRNFAVLKELHLPLKSCNILAHPDLDQEVLRTTLDYFAPSVKTIAVREENDCLRMPLWFEEFPFGIQLDNLTRFDMRGDLTGSFRFLRYMPNLSELNVFDRHQDYNGDGLCRSVTEAVSNTSRVEVSNLKMERLMTLSLEYFVKDEDIQTLFEWLPNVIELKMALDDKQFGMVCRKWKRLKQLRVVGERLTAANGVLENIANLEKLEVLILNFRCSPKTVFDLFLLLPSLQSLVHYCPLKSSVKRGRLDLTSYQQAIQDNVAEQWIADLRDRAQIYDRL